MDTRTDYAIRLDEQGTIRNWNDTAEKIEGYTCNEITGRYFDILYTKNERDKGTPEKLLDEARSNGIAKTNAKRLRKDGSDFLATILVVADYEYEKKINGFYEIVQNIPEHENQAEYDFRNLQALVNNTDDLIWSIDINRKLILSNSSFDRRIWEIAGKTIEKGVSVFDSGFDKATMERYDHYYKRAFSGEHFLTTEYVAAPSERWYEVSFYPLKKKSLIYATVCNAKDITERIKAEIKLEISEQRFRSLIEHSADVFIILSKEIKPVYISPSLFNVLGYTPEEATDMNIFSLIDAVDYIHLRETLGKVLTNPGIPVKYECRICHKDTTQRSIEGTITNRLNDTAINGIVYNFNDITERKLAEERALHVNRLYTFISLINRAIVQINDEESLFREVCQVAIGIGKFAMAWIGVADTEQKKISLVASEGILAREQNLFVNLPYNDYNVHASVINEGNYYLCNDIPNSIDTLRIKPYATELGVRSCMIFPIKKMGKVYGTINLYAREKNYFNIPEISLLREVSADISFALDFLEKDKAHLAAEKLSQELERERELNELKSSFVSMASHEFRTPLSAIQSSAYLLSKYTTTAEQPQRDKHIDRIVSSVSSMTDTLSDFLSLGKIEEGNIDPDPCLYDIKKQMEEVIHEIQHLLKKGQSIDYTHSGFDTVFLDPGMIKHIVTNLLSNALKFSPENTLAALKTNNTKDQFIMSVRDNGIGIPKEDQEKLFKRFFRSSNATNIQGTGVGLYIVKKYIQLMNGNITCISEEGKGTEFILTFELKNSSYENNTGC